MISGLNDEYTIFLICILGVICIVVFAVYFLLRRHFEDLKTNNEIDEKSSELDMDSLYKTIGKAGYAYDENQDIFYSIMNPWQRRCGYCYIYDESAAPFGMIIDCEPIYFEYEGKKWLIEFWKGQYDLTIGGEIGVYTANKADLNFGTFKGTFYNCASDKELLEMSFELKRNCKTLFKRKDRHWWLTGFKLGEFSSPAEITMCLSITLKDNIMRNSFVEALKKAGYVDGEITINDNTVSLEFDKPKTPQPITRTAETDWIIQKKNKILCDEYQKITGSYNNFPDKINAVYKYDPKLFNTILSIGKNRGIFEKYEEIKDYLK